MDYLVSYIQDDAFKTTTPIGVFHTIEEAKNFILDDYFDGDEEAMNEFEVLPEEANCIAEYINNCKGARISEMSNESSKPKPSHKRLNDGENYESIGTFKLSKENTPIAFEEKVLELLEETDLTREEAEKHVNDMEIELEIYYEKGFGLFAVETDAVDSLAIIASPYSGELYEPWVVE